MNIKELLKANELLFFIFAIVSLVIFRLLLIINVPEWGWDEYSYLHDARIIYYSLQDSLLLHQQIYQWVIGNAFKFKNNYFVALKVINVFLVFLGSMLTYSLARKFVSQRYALVSLILSLTIGGHTWAGHAMTESIIFPSYLMLILCLISYSIWVVDFSKNSNAITIIEIFKHLLFSLLLGSIFAFCTCVSIKFYTIGIPLLLLLLGFEVYCLLSSGNKLLFFIRVIGIISGVFLFYHLYEWLIFSSHHYTRSYMPSRFAISLFFNQIYNKPYDFVQRLIGDMGTIFFNYSTVIGLGLVLFRKSWKYKNHHILYMMIFIFLGFLASYAQYTLFMITEGYHTHIGKYMMSRYIYFSLAPLLSTFFILKDPFDKVEKTILTTVIVIFGICSFLANHTKLVNIIYYCDAESWGNAAHYSSTHLYFIILHLLCIILIWKLSSIRKLQFFLMITFLYGSINSGLFLAEQLGNIYYNEVSGCQVMKMKHLSVNQTAAFIGYNRLSHERSVVLFPMHNSFLLNRLPSGVAVADSLIKNKGDILSTIRDSKINFKRYNLLFIDSFPGKMSDSEYIIDRTESCIVVDLDKIHE